MTAPRIAPVDAREKIRKGESLLVCAYDDDAKCSQIYVDGAISFREFQRRASSLARDQEIIFY